MSTVSIDKIVEGLANRKQRTLNAVCAVAKFWSKHVDVLGRLIGDYTLERLRYSNVEGGVDDYITSNDGPVTIIYGHGYTGCTSGADYQTFRLPNASRQNHIHFLKNFKKQLLRHLEQLKEQENSATEELAEIEKKFQ